MKRHLFFVSFITVVISWGHWVIKSPKAYAEEPKALPIYFYWDNESPDMDEDEIARHWNKLWGWRGQLNGRKMKNCSDIEMSLSGSPYNYQVAYEL
jgi:hypothetical protein